MTSETRSAFWRGIRAGAPFILIVLPFALVFGVVATEAGLDIAQTMGLTVLVIAGASQLTAIQLMAEGAPVFMVLAASLAVNMRMAMYSAALTPHLGAAPLWQRALAAYTMVDQVYAVSALTYEREPARSVAWKAAFYFGALTPIVPLWYAGSLAGALLGDAIPPEIALDAAVPVAFIAIFAPALRTRAHVAAAGTAILAALVFAWLPWNLGLILAALAGMLAGAEIERRNPEIVA